MYFSVTEIQSYKRCRRQWDYGSFNRQGLTPIMQPKPYLDLGTMVHKTLAYWREKPGLGTHDDGSPLTLRQVFMAIAAQHRRAVIDKYVAATGYVPSTEDMEPLLGAIVLGASMMENYQTYYGHPLPLHLKFCAPEQEILVPIPGTEHPCGCTLVLPPAPACRDCNGTGKVWHYLKMRLDALAQDVRENLYVVECKTYNSRPDLTLLEVTDQFIGYVWGAQQLDMGPVIGLAYDGMWKRATPPQRPKKLTIADLFTRTIIRPQQDEVDEYGVETARAVLEMANDPYIYKNRVWQGCWDCSFENLCRSQSQALDIDYIISTQYTRRTEDDASEIVQQVENTFARTGA